MIKAVWAVPAAVIGRDSLGMLAGARNLAGSKIRRTGASRSNIGAAASAVGIERTIRSANSTNKIKLGAWM